MILQEENAVKTLWNKQKTRARVFCGNREGATRKLSLADAALAHSLRDFHDPDQDQENWPTRRNKAFGEVPQVSKEKIEAQKDNGNRDNFVAHTATGFPLHHSASSLHVIHHM